MRKAWGSTGLGLVLAACGGSGEGDDGSGVTLEFVATDSASLSAGEGDTQLDMTRLELQLREVKMLGDTADGNSDKLHLKGTFTLNLLDANDNSLQLELPPGTYKKIEFKVDKTDGTDGIDGGGASLWFEGTKGLQRFRYLDDSMEKITLRTVEDVQLADGGSELVRIELDVPSWLDGVDLAELEAGDDGMVVIDGSGPNRKAHDVIEGNIKEAIKTARKPK